MKGIHGASALDILFAFISWGVDLKVVLGQPITTPYVHVNQACSPRGLTKSFVGHSSSNIVAFNFHAGDDMVLAA
eukprot:1160913-Pelagomonas_calceolata.AAC.7